MSVKIFFQHYRAVPDIRLIASNGHRANGGVWIGVIRVCGQAPDQCTSTFMNCHGSL
jgi:hypothetical protein